MVIHYCKDTTWGSMGIPQFVVLIKDDIHII